MAVTPVECGCKTLHKPEGTSRVGGSAIRWLDLVEEDVEKMGLRNRRRESPYRDHRRSVAEEAEVSDGLQFH